MRCRGVLCTEARQLGNCPLGHCIVCNGAVSNVRCTRIARVVRRMATVEFAAETTAGTAIWLAPAQVLVVVSWFARVKNLPARIDRTFDM